MGKSEKVKNFTFTFKFCPHNIVQNRKDFLVSQSTADNQKLVNFIMLEA